MYTIICDADIQTRSYIQRDTSSSLLYYYKSAVLQKNRHRYYIILLYIYITIGIYGEKTFHTRLVPIVVFILYTIDKLQAKLLYHTIYC